MEISSSTAATATATLATATLATATLVGAAALAAATPSEATTKSRYEIFKVLYQIFDAQPPFILHGRQVVNGSSDRQGRREWGAGSG